ncbi:MAG: hypothetical protein KDD42_05190 [Bdellovibrionales bacterium]|nr:hypothetical protein [Bdellovibrionales bacterium]
MSKIISAFAQTTAPISGSKLAQSTELKLEAEALLASVEAGEMGEKEALNIASELTLAASSLDEDKESIILLIIAVAILILIQSGHSGNLEALVVSETLPKLPS